MPNRLIGESVSAAVITAARADSELAALLSVSPLDGGPAVYDGIAPPAAAYDYLVVLAPSETPANTLGKGWGAAVLVYLRAVSRQKATAHAIASRAVALFDAPDTPLCIDAYGSPPVPVASELVDAGPGYTEEIRGEVIHHYPAVLRVMGHE